MDRVRLEAIEKRRQICSDLVRQRKEKLKQLFWLSTHPYELMNEETCEDKRYIDRMMEFLELNDLENGKRFDYNKLAKFTESIGVSQSKRETAEEKDAISAEAATEEEEVAATTVAEEEEEEEKEKETDGIKTKESNQINYLQVEASIEGTQKKTHKIELEDELESKKRKIEETVDSVEEDKNFNERSKSQQVTPSPYTHDIESTPMSIQRSFNQTPNATPLKSVISELSDARADSNAISAHTYHELSPPISEHPEEPPSLIDMINYYENEGIFKRADERSSRDLKYNELSIEELLVTLLPESKPHKLAEARSLTELHYHQQTLPLPKLLLRAHKTLTTSAYETSLVEGKVSVLHSRIEELKRKNGWSLRQPRRPIDPFLQFGKLSSPEDANINVMNKKTHWDNLLSEAKWLSMDIKQGKRWRMAQCVFMAQSVLDFWTYGEVCCIRRRKIVHLTREQIEEAAQKFNKKFNSDLEFTAVTEHTENKDQLNEIEDTHATESGESENLDVLMQDNDKNSGLIQHEQTSNDDVVKQLEDTEDYYMFDRSEIPERKLPVVSYDQYMAETKDASPFKLFADVNAMTVAEVAVVDNLPEYAPFSTKEVDHLVERERYAHVSALLPPPDEEPEYEKLVFKKLDDTGKSQIRCSKNGLFGPYRRINILKPPKPSSISQLNIRIPTIWLPQDDKYLIKYVSDFSFNWDIISAHLSPKPTKGYTSNIERRTPWQCFERYIQLNDKFQFTDMRGMYAERAKIWLENAHRVQASTKRRISPLGVGTESIQRGNRRLRWAAMFDAMKRSIKKRETEAKVAPKNHKPPSEATKRDVPDPADLALLKYERDKAMQETYSHHVANRIRNTTGRQSSSGRNGRLPFNGKLTPQQQHQLAMHRAQQVVKQQQAGIKAASQLTPEQIQKLMQLKRQRQQSQKQSALLQQSIQQGKISASNSSSASTTPQMQQALLGQNNINGTRSPNSMNVNMAASIMKHAKTANMGSPESSSNSSNGSLAPTPEQVLQQAKGISQSPTPPAAKIQKNSSSSSGSGLGSNGRKSTWNTSQVQILVQQIKQQHPNMDHDTVMRTVATLLHKAQNKQQEPISSKYSIQQLDTLINSPGTSETQKMQLKLYKRQAMERQAKALSARQGSNSSTSGDKIGSPSITTRFTPQAGSSKPTKGEGSEEGMDKWINDE